MSYCEDIQVNNIGMIPFRTNGPVKMAASPEKVSETQFAKNYFR